MKKFFSALFQFTLFFGLIFSALAQTDTEKKLRKEWANKMKETDPLVYKKTVQNYDSVSKQAVEKTALANDLQIQNSKLIDSLSKLGAELSKLQEEYKGYKSNMVTAKTPDKNETDATITESKKEKLYKGVIFKVQIGAFKNKDLSKFFENHKNFSGDVDPDGLKKYTLGYFDDYWEADTFKKYLREMGVKDAWIVPYKNGQRVKIRDVLEGLI
jgi:hypothetical protein